MPDMDLPLSPSDPDAVLNSTCASLSSCFVCLRNERCGWCVTDNVCIPGDSWGPTTNAQCSSKWDYMSGQCYFTQSALLLAIFATLFAVVLLVTLCGFYTYYKLRRQRLVAREYVRIFTEYSAHQSALQRQDSLGASSGRGLVHSRSQGSGIVRYANGPISSYFSPTSPVLGAAAATSPNLGAAVPPPPPPVPAMPYGPWYGSVEDHDADAEPWEPVRRTDSGVLAGATGDKQLRAPASATTPLLRSTSGRGRGRAREPPSGAAARNSGDWNDRRESLLSQFRRNDG
ncbi:hypothetical protein H9P43_004706 [Blastocladiella emersonii ATCC 22665]|nr:hypothetical protein H9P43_004706 [Blastocladiella emersonii ATCC 22665]